jgi:hypothetical protein
MFSYNIMENKDSNEVDPILSENIEGEKKEETEENEKKKDTKIMDETITTKEISISEITDLATKLNELYMIIANGELKSAYLP